MTGFMTIFITFYNLNLAPTAPNYYGRTRKLGRAFLPTLQRLGGTEIPNLEAIKLSRMKIKL